MGCVPGCHTVVLSNHCWVFSSRPRPDPALPSSWLPARAGLQTTSAHTPSPCLLGEPPAPARNAHPPRHPLFLPNRSHDRIPYYGQADGSQAEDGHAEQVQHGVAGLRRGHVFLHAGQQHLLGEQGHSESWGSGLALPPMPGNGVQSGGGARRGRAGRGRKGSLCLLPELLLQPWPIYSEPRSRSRVPALALGTAGCKILLAVPTLPSHSTSWHQGTPAPATLPPKCPSSLLLHLWALPALCAVRSWSALACLLLEGFPDPSAQEALRPLVSLTSTSLT